MLPLLDEALALAPTSGRIDARLLALLERLRHVADDEALGIADAIDREARERGMRGFELWAAVRSVAAAARLEAASLARRVQRLDALAGRVHCYGMAPAEVWLAQAQAALAQRDDARARALAAEGARWLQAAAGRVPDVFRDAFLHRHPLNVELAALARRLAA